MWGPEKGPKLQKLRGMQKHEKSEALQVLCGGCEVGDMGKTPQDEARGDSKGHIE